MDEVKRENELKVEEENEERERVGKKIYKGRGLRKKKVSDIEGEFSDSYDDEEQPEELNVNVEIDGDVESNYVSSNDFDTLYLLVEKMSQHILSLV